MDPLQKLSMEVSVENVEWLKTVSEDAGRGIQLRFLYQPEE